MSKPFLKWAGGKHKLVPFIRQFIPHTTKRIIEPFAGSASLSMAIDAESYLLNDSNRDLINLFRVLKDHKGGVLPYFNSYFTPANNTKSQYYEFRERFNQLDAGEEKAGLFLYLNRHCFNGLCRYNASGGFNVPFGRYTKPYFPEAELRAFIAKSDRIELMSGDFADVFTKIKDGDTIYCDPPYLPLSPTSNFTSYAQNGFNFDDQKRLAGVCRLASSSNTVIISNHNTPESRALYDSAYIHAFDVQRNISAKSDSRKKVGELLAVYGGGI